MSIEPPISSVAAVSTLGLGVVCLLLATATLVDEQAPAPQPVSQAPVERAPLRKPDWVHQQEFYGLDTGRMILYTSPGFTQQVDPRTRRIQP